MYIHFNSVFDSLSLKLGMRAFTTFYQMPNVECFRSYFQFQVIPGLFGLMLKWNEQTLFHFNECLTYLRVIQLA